MSCVHGEHCQGVGCFYDQGRADERAAVASWLRAHAVEGTFIGGYVAEYAERIERGEHLHSKESQVMYRDFTCVCLPNAARHQQDCPEFWPGGLRRLNKPPVSLTEAAGVKANKPARCHCEHWPAAHSHPVNEGGCSFCGCLKYEPARVAESPDAADIAEAEKALAEPGLTVWRALDEWNRLREKGVCSFCLGTGKPIFATESGDK